MVDGQPWIAALLLASSSVRAAGLPGQPVARIPAVDWEILSAGLIVAVPLIAAMWRAARLRGDLYQQWNQRVGLAEAGLSEAAVARLKALRGQVDRLLALEARFSADPADLRPTVSRYLQFIRARARAGSYFRAVLRIGPALFASLCITEVGVIATFAEWCGLFDSSRIWWAGVLTAGGGAACSLSCLLVYAFLQIKLSSCEIMSREGHE